jgi:hypothetical protein
VTIIQKLYITTDVGMIEGANCLHVDCFHTNNTLKGKIFTAKSSAEIVGRTKHFGIYTGC